MALFAVTALIVAVAVTKVHFLNFGEPLDQVLEVGISSLLISLISQAYLDGEEPVKYFLSWFWAFFVSEFFLGYTPFFPYRLGLLTYVASPLLYAIVGSAVTSLVRLNRVKQETHGLPSLQMWSATVVYVSFFLLSHFFKLDRLADEVIPFFLFSYLLSFFAVGKEYGTSFNLSLIGLLATAGFLTGDAILKTGLILPVLVLGIALLYYGVTMRVVVVYTKKGIAGGVVTSKFAVFLFPLVTILVWHAISHYVGYLPYPNKLNFSVIFLPETVGNVIVDTLKGRKLDVAGGGIVGGVGLADGLWLDLVATMLYYLFFLTLGLYFGSIAYVISSLIISAISL